MMRVRRCDNCQLREKWFYINVIQVIEKIEDNSTVPTD